MADTAHGKLLSIAEDVGDALNAFHDQRGWEINGDEHSLEMLMADVILFARATGISLDKVMVTATELAGETLNDIGQC